jgi:DNA end-binding protein Ku
LARNLWKGAISFSLIHIPVALRSATRTETLDLDLLDRRDFSPVGYQRINKATGENVEWGDIVKGYAWKRGEYVVLTDEDFRRANVAATQTIEIRSFVDSDSVPPYYFDTPYFLAPQPRGEKVYALLRDALTRSRKLALAMAVIRTRQYLCALLPVDDVLMLNTLRYADEILPIESVEQAANAKTSATDKEMKLARRLIDEMSEPWDPTAFRDTYRDDVLKRVKEKVANGETRELTKRTRAPKPAVTQNVADLSALLRRSLETKSGSAREPRASKRARRVRRARAQRRA